MEGAFLGLCCRQMRMELKLKNKLWNSKWNVNDEHLYHVRREQVELFTAAEKLKMDFKSTELAKSILLRIFLHKKMKNYFH